MKPLIIKCYQRSVISSVLGQNILLSPLFSSTYVLPLMSEINLLSTQNNVYLMLAV
jgi:hypothetical protein